ncbi:MAG: preprotein translocase subunit SecE [Acidaminococcaceae bacterium]|jgi:preprotein translocase subunit SecE|nr:preprotein translocase subunit SecE [Acidaminococcaceae bacterium]
MAVPKKAKAKAVDVKSANGISVFFRETKNEMKKVTWPGKQEMIVDTIVVIIAVLFIAGLIWIIDSVFGHVLRLLLGV